MEINTAENELTSFSIKSEDGNTTYASASKFALNSPDYTTVAFGYQKNGSVSTTNYEQLKSIKITQTTQSKTYANYTVHFVDGDGATVKADEVRNGEVSTTVRANNNDQTTYYANDYKYVYNNDGNGVVVNNAGTSEMTITYDKYGKYTATASAVNGETTLVENIASATAYVGETATIQLQKYIKVNNVWYVNSSNNYVDATQAGNTSVTYNEADIDYFYEFESLSGGRTDETNKSYSGGIRSRVGKNSSLTTPEEISAGIYTLTVPCSNSNVSAGKLYLYTVLNNTETDTELTIDCPSGNRTETKTLTVPEGCALRFKNTSTDNNDNCRVDSITLKKIGDIPSVGQDVISNGSFTTNSDGWVLDNYNWHKIQEFNNTCEVESWASNNRPAGSVTQSVGYLPAGNYAISASVLSKAEAYLKVLDASDDSEIASINCTGSKEIDNTVATSFTLNEIKNVKVQFSTPAQEGGPYWSYITNVSMIYYGSETPVVSKMAVSASNIAKYGTFYAPYEVKIPTLIKAYTAQNNAAGTGLTLTEITDGTIPAYTPVILENNRANDNTFNGVFYGLTAAGSQASSALTGTLEEYTLQEGDYIMQYQNSVTAFYPVSGDAIGKKVAANRCYIAAGTEAKASLTIAPNDVTGVKGVSAEAKNVPMKRIVNGQLVIEKDGKQYNAMGQEK